MGSLSCSLSQIMQLIEYENILLHISRVLDESKQPTYKKGQKTKLGLCLKITISLTFTVL